MTDEEETQMPNGANPWVKLLAVQEVDTRLAQLDHRASHLPEREARDRIDAELARVRTETMAADEAKHELLRGQKRLEDEIATIEEKIGREEEKMSGSSDPGLLQDLDREIASLRARVTALEDEELELMEQTEPIDARLDALAVEQQQLDAEAETANAALAEAEAVIDDERTMALTEREGLIAAIDAAAVTRYDKARARMGGTAVAALVGGTCGACHMKLSAVDYDRVLHLPPNAEVTCEECGRFLVRT